MAQVRPTFQQRLFSDEQLGLPLHDQIVRWTDKTLRNRVHVVLAALGIDHMVDAEGVTRAWDSQTRFSVEIEGRPSNWGASDKFDLTVDALARRLAPPLPEPPAVVTEGVQWEAIIKDERGTVLGAADLKAVIQIPEAALCGRLEQSVLSMTSGPAAEFLDRHKYRVLVGDGEDVWVSGERETTIARLPELARHLANAVARDRKVYRLAELKWKHLGKNYYRRLTIMAEAKTSIRTAGELMRQINFYRSATDSSTRFLVVAPADAWREDLEDILREQRVTPLTYLTNG